MAKYMKTRANWRVKFRHEPRHTWGTTVLRVLTGTALLSVTAGAVYAIYLMNTLATDLHQLSAKMDKLDSMQSVASDIHELTGHLTLIDEANQRIARMEKYMAYIPQMANTGDEALAQSLNMNAKMDLTNERLQSTDECLVNTMTSLSGITDGLKTMPGELRETRASIEKMPAQLPSLDEMRGFLSKTNASLDTTSNSITKVSADFDEMRTLLKGLCDQFTVLPQMRDSLDQTQATITGTLAAFSPLAHEIPKFTSSLEEMTRTTQQMTETTKEMNQTTKDMAQSMKKLPKQGTLSIGILTAAELLAH